MSITHETAMRLIGIEITILGSILNPFVSSSKKRIRPPLDAGNGADFFLLLMVALLTNFYIKTLLFVFDLF